LQRKQVQKIDREVVQQRSSQAQVLLIVYYNAACHWGEFVSFTRSFFLGSTTLSNVHIMGK
jgi:hypothetical protein